MELTQIVDWIEQPNVGYVINAAFSPENSDILMKLIADIEKEYGDSVFCMPKQSLHITLLDWIAPLIDYDGQNKQELFNKIYARYGVAMNDIIVATNNIDVTFGQIHVSPSTIYIAGQDGGQFQEIRNKFLEVVDLLPGTKQPPTIIHSSLARFRQPIELNVVEGFLNDKAINFTQKIDSFRLVHTTKEPMLEFAVLKKYYLK